MENKMQRLETVVDATVWNAFVECMYASPLVTTKITATANLGKNKSTKNYECQPNIEVVVVDPNCFYSSESEDSDSDSDIDIEDSIDCSDPSQLPVHQEPDEPTSQKQVQPTESTSQKQVQPTESTSQIQVQLTESTPQIQLQPTESTLVKQVQSTKSTLVEQVLPLQPSEPAVKHLSQSHLDENMDEPEPPTEDIIDNLFDSVPFHIEDDVLLQDMEDNNQSFDLAAYITDGQSTSMNLPSPSHQLTPVKIAVNNNNKYENNVAVHPTAHLPTEVRDSKNTTENYRRGCTNLKRSLADDSSDSEDDCKKSKKRKVDDDPLWIPSKRKSNCKFDVRTGSSQPAGTGGKSNNSVLLENTKIPTVNGIRYGIGRGKDIATLTQYFKRTSSSDSTDDGTAKTCNRTFNKSTKTTTPPMEIKIKKQTSEQFNDAKKDDSGNKSTDSSDFGKFIAATISAVPSSRKSNKTKRTNLQTQSRVNRFVEHSVSFRKYLSDKAARTLAKVSQPSQPSKLHDTAPQSQTGSSELLKTRESVDNTNSKLPEHQTKLQIEAPCDKRKITIREYQQRKTVEPNNGSEGLSIDSNRVIKRKITIEEYYKRKGIQTA